MILSVYCQMLPKITRLIRYFGVRKNNTKAMLKTVHTFWHDIVCVTAAVSQMRKDQRLTSPEHQHDRRAFETLFSIRILVALSVPDLLCRSFGVRVS